MTLRRLIAVIAAVAALVAAPVRAVLPADAAVRHAAHAAAHHPPVHGGPAADHGHAGPGGDAAARCPSHAGLAAGVEHPPPGAPPADGGPGTSDRPPDCCSMACAALALPAVDDGMPSAPPPLLKARLTEREGPTLAPAPPLRPPKA